MQCEMKKAAEHAREGARIVEHIGDVYDTASLEGWAYTLKLLATCALEKARERAREPSGDR